MRSFSGQEADLVGEREFNGAVEGRDPIWRTTRLFKVPQREHGKRYFLMPISHGASQTWIADEAAAQWLQGPRKS